MPDGPVPDDTAPDDTPVRALLASLRDPDPTVPPEVAARLEARLADLTDGPADHAPGTVVSLPARPAGGRTARGLLVAAAVAAVVGLGAVQVLDPLGGGSGSVESTGDTAVTADQPSSARAEDGAEGEAEGFAADAPESLDDAPAGAGLPSLTTRSFALDVAALPSEPADPARPPASCTPGGLSLETDVRAVLLDARPGVLALLPAGTDGAGPGSRVAEAWQCGDLTGPAGTAAPPRVRVIIAAG